MRYNPAEIEPKWQAVWEDQKTFKAPTEIAALKAEAEILRFRYVSLSEWSGSTRRTPGRLHGH